MRLQISIFCDDKIKLPIHYNSAIQGMIYSNISPELGHQLHEIGYLYEKRKFKLFTFSSLNGQYRIDRQSSEILFASPVKLIISSPIERFVFELGYSMLTNDDLRLGENHVWVANFESPPDPEISSSELIGMLSPMTVYSTLKTADGGNKTYYYLPYEREFSQLIEENLKKKYSLIYNKKVDESQSVSIKPFNVDKRSEKILRFKGTIIKAWRGVYLIEGDPELIKVGYDTGLGSKNSQGFGCFKFLQRGDEYDRRDYTDGPNPSGQG